MKNLSRLRKKPLKIRWKFGENALAKSYTFITQCLRLGCNVWVATPYTDVHWHIRNFGATGGSKSSYETGESSPRPGASARIVLGLISVRTLSLDEVRPSHREPLADELHSEGVKSIAEVTVASCRAGKANIKGLAGPAWFERWRTFRKAVRIARYFDPQ